MEKERERGGWSECEGNMLRLAVEISWRSGDVSEAGRNGYWEVSAMP